MFSTVKTRFRHRELPKTDNTYCSTSKYYGCTLAPGIPLIPNLCRRPLRSPTNGEYEYSFSSFTKSFFNEANSNAHNRWIEKNNVINNNLDNGNSHNPVGMTKLPRRRISFQDSGLDSDSDFEDSQYHKSQNTVTWFSYIITTITTIVTYITETVVGQQNYHNHVNTRVPLKQAEGISWYQYPVLWLYKFALLVHRADIWLLHKVHSVLHLDSWGTWQQRRKWALIILLIPLILWACFKLMDWFWEGTPVSDDPSASYWFLYPLTVAWNQVTSWFSSSWAWLSAAWAWFPAIWAWFDGSWLLAPWLAFNTWIEGNSRDHFIIDKEEFVEQTFDHNWTEAITLPFVSVAALFTSLGEFLGNVLSALGEDTITLFSVIGSSLYAAFAWIVSCVISVPSLLSSLLGLIVYPFQSISWESTTQSMDYPPSAPVESVHYQTSSASADISVLENLLRDKHFLALLARNVLNSEEFNQAVVERQSTNQDQVNSVVNSAFSAALAKINLEFNKVKEELNTKIKSEESSVEAKMDALKQQLQELQVALMAHKTLVSEQAALGNRLEARVISTEKLQIQEDEEFTKLKEQIMIEVAKVKEEINEQLVNVQLNQKIVKDLGDSSHSTNSSELEAFVNSTVERLLAIYDADKIAKVDYALASSGGSVLNVRCTETFSKKNAQYYMWGYPLWSRAANDPKIALEPAINPGECWAFTGSRGYLVIELSENIIVTAFTMEHLPRSLSPTGNIDTAPKDFRVLGLESEQDEAPILLGRFRYEDNGVSLQHFQALEVDHAFKIVELVIESNHGNLEYTCLYRFRVHGHPSRL